MALPDLAILSDAGGWVLSVAVMLGILGLVITGRLVPGPTHDREVRRGDAQDVRLDALAEIAKEQTSLLKTLLALQERPRGTR